MTHGIPYVQSRCEVYTQPVWQALEREKEVGERARAQSALSIPSLRARAPGAFPLPFPFLTPATHTQVRFTHCKIYLIVSLLSY